jgi:hypothetical protein
LSANVAVIVADDLRAIAAVTTGDPGPEPVLFADPSPEPCANPRTNSVHVADPSSKLCADDPKPHSRPDTAPEPSADDPRPHSRTDPGSDGSTN